MTGRILFFLIRLRGLSKMSFEPFDTCDYIEPQLVEYLDWALKNIVDNEQPLGIVIDGSPGMAKTTTASLLGLHLQDNFDVDAQVGRGIEQFIKAYNYTIDKIKAKVKVVVYDEANDSDKGASRGRINRILNNVLVATSRQEAIILIVVLHRFYRLDEKFFDNGLIDCLINIDDKVNKKYSHFRIYDMDSLAWMSSQIKRGKVLKKPLVYKSSAPNLCGRFRAPPDDFIREVALASKIGKDFLRKKSSRDILSSQYYSVPVLASMLQVTKSAVEYRIKKFDLKKTYVRDKVGKMLFFDKDILGVLKKIFEQESKVSD